SYTDQGRPQRATAGSTAFQYDVTGLSVITTTSAITYVTRLPDGSLLSERQRVLPHPWARLQLAWAGIPCSPGGIPTPSGRYGAGPAARWGGQASGHQHDRRGA